MTDERRTRHEDTEGVRPERQQPKRRTIAGKIVSMRPYPVEVRVSHYRAGGMAVTGIYRRWHPGDTAFCKRCPICTAHDDACLITVGMFVPKDQAADFDASSLPRNRSFFPGDSLLKDDGRVRQARHIGSECHRLRTYESDSGSPLEVEQEGDSGFVSLF